MCLLHELEWTTTFTPHHYIHNSRVHLHVVVVAEAVLTDHTRHVNNAWHTTHATVGAAVVGQGVCSSMLRRISKDRLEVRQNLICVVA